MSAYLLKSLLAHIRSGRTLFALSVLGVALGVASVLSIQIINRNALGAFEGSARAVSGDADLFVRGRSTTLPEELYPRILAQPGVAAARPMHRVDVALAGRDDFYLEVIGLDLFVAMELPWDQAPVGRGVPIHDPGWVAVSTRLGQQQGWKVGDRFDVTSGSRRVTLRVGALVDFHRISPLASSRMLVMDIAQAQHHFGLRGRIHQVDIRAAEGADVEALSRRLGAVLGEDAQVLTPDQRRKQVAGLLGAFRLNLTALSMISLFVGLFLVYSSTQASLVRRRNEFGVLRSMGMTRGQTLGLILADAALLGLLGSLLGVPLGYAVAARNVEVVSATLSNLYLLQEIETLRIPAWLYGLAAATGVGGSLLASLFPALDMSREDTRALLAAYTLQERAARWALPLFLTGLGIIGIAALGFWALPRDWRPGGFIVGFGILGGIPLTAPWCISRVTARLPIFRFGLGYGIKGLGLHLQRAGIAVAALAVAVTMLVGITVMIGSFRRTIEIWIDDTLRADVYVSSESWRRGREAATLDDDVIRRLTQRAGVAHSDRLRQIFVGSGEKRLPVSGVDFSGVSDPSRFSLLAGEPAEVLRAVRDEGAVIITEPLARKGKLKVGDTLELFGPRGAVELTVAGVSYDYSNENGGVGMDLRAMNEAFGPGQVSNVALYLEPDIDVERFVDGLKADLADVPLLIRSDRAIREEVYKIFDQTFAVTQLLQAMSLLIAVCGVLLTLIILSRERVSELALYRALGAGRAQIFRVFLGKGIGISIFGSILGSLGGAALALVLIFLINRAYFGWTIALYWPWRLLAMQFVTILAAAAAASVYPAFRASRTPATELSRENL